MIGDRRGKGGGGLLDFTPSLEPRTDVGGELQGREVIGFHPLSGLFPSFMFGFCWFEEEKELKGRVLRFHSHCGEIPTYGFQFQLGGLGLELGLGMSFPFFFSFPVEGWKSVGRLKLEGREEEDR